MSKYRFPFVDVVFGILFSIFSAFSVASKVGDTLTALSFDTIPNNFHYAANGKAQLITVYPAKPSSMKNGDFNARIQTLGFCPLAITDIFNKVWYAPVKVVEMEMRSRLKKPTHRAECILAGDYDGMAVDVWKLKRGAVTIVVDGNGVVEFIEYGVLSETQQQEAIFLMQKSRTSK